MHTQSAVIGKAQNPFMSWGPIEAHRRHVQAAVQAVSPLTVVLREGIGGILEVWDRGRDAKLPVPASSLPAGRYEEEAMGYVIGHVVADGAGGVRREEPDPHAAPPSPVAPRRFDI